MKNEDTSQQEEATLLARGLRKCYRRQRYLLKERKAFTTNDNGVELETVVARMIMVYSEKAAKKQENTEMKIDFGESDFLWIHPDDYAENRFSYANSQPVYQAPEVVVEVVEEVKEVEAPTAEAIEKFIEPTVMIAKTESAEEIFKGMTVEQMRLKCAKDFNFKLSKTVLNRATALKKIKAHLED